MLRMNFRIAVDLCIRVSILEYNAKIHIPDVLVIRNRAFVRLARPSILSVPMKDVLIVLTGFS